MSDPGFGKKLLRGEVRGRLCRKRREDVKRHRVLPAYERTSSD